MNFKTEDIDRIFSGAETVLNTSHDVCAAISDGLSGIKANMDSRRNMYGNAPQQSQFYQQPVHYGYGYANNDGFNNYFSNNGMTSPIAMSGYPGFTNPAYGGGI